MEGDYEDDFDDSEADDEDDGVMNFGVSCCITSYS